MFWLVLVILFSIAVFSTIYLLHKSELNNVKKILDYYETKYIDIDRDMKEEIKNGK